MISVIIPIGGGRPERKQRLETYLNVTLREQSNSNFEVIIVEQSLDGKYYYDDLPGIRHFKIQDPLNRGFSEGYCYNVGARHAKGDVVALLGMDFVFGVNFLKDAEATLIGNDFLFACNECVFATQEETDQFYNSRDINWLLSQKGYASFTPLRGAAVGVCFVKKEAYFNKYGGWYEGYFGWGKHDKSWAKQVADIEKTLVPLLPILPHKIIHLCHDKERHLDLVNEDSDKIYDALCKISPEDYVRLNSGCGNLNQPHLICLEDK